MAATVSTPAKLVDPRDLLELMRQHPITTPFNLAFYAEQHGRKGLLEAIHTVCAPLDEESLCTLDCYQMWEESLSHSQLTDQPAIHSCAKGFLCFTIHLPEGKGLPDYLIGGGVFERKTSTNSNMEENDQYTTDDAMIEPGQYPQLITLTGAKSIVNDISRALPRMLNQQVHALSLTRTTQRLEAVQKLTHDLADCKSSDQAVVFVSEALIVLFDLPKVLIVLQRPGHPMTIHSTLGLDQDAFQFDQKRLADYFTKSSGHLEILPGKEFANLFPGLETPSAYLFPLQEDGCLFGAIALLDVDLHCRDLALIDLLVNRLATQLVSLATAAGHRQERQVSARLVTMISDLSLVDNRQELYRQILEMSAELLMATSGSLMLLNENDGILKIAAAKGMNSSLAKTMSVAYGEGIAGRVAKSGFPMLVNDIERDKRVAAKNRPRFKTKSFISLPLEIDDRLIGVLNLADKSNNSNFSEVDLNLIQTFTNHAVLMIDRAAALEKAGQFEQLAITDPLTGLYNRRLLENRLQEEFSRSERQQQNFCIILADLDNFKVYNDICGHLAGDNALRKTADLLRRTAREMDIVTRYGGEEFCLILPGIGKKESVFVADRIRRAIETERFSGESHLPLGRLTISLGIAAFPVDGVTTNELIHAADLALYQAKALGRNRLVLYEPSMDDQSLRSHHE